MTLKELQDKGWNFKMRKKIIKYKHYIGDSRSTWNIGDELQIKKRVTGFITKIRYNRIKNITIIKLERIINYE